MIALFKEKIILLITSWYFPQIPVSLKDSIKTALMLWYGRFSWFFCYFNVSRNFSSFPYRLTQLAISWQRASKRIEIIWLSRSRAARKDRNGKPKYPHFAERIEMVSVSSLWGHYLIKSGAWRVATPQGWLTISILSQTLKRYLYCPERHPR